MKDIFPGFVLYFVIIGFALAFSYAASQAMRDYEVIEPAPGIQCVVVSRMFNTSTDCWTKP